MPTPHPTAPLCSRLPSPSPPAPALPGQEYKLLFEGAGSNPGDKTLEDRFFEHEVSAGPACRREGLLAQA